MDITLPGHSAPAVGFEVPLEMLAACHGRVQAQCATLLRLVLGAAIVATRFVIDQATPFSQPAICGCRISVRRCCAW